MAALTPEEVARFRADGKTLRKIAAEVGVSITTIRRWEDPAYRARHNASQRRSRRRNRERVEARRQRYLERTAPRCSRCGRPLARPTASCHPVLCGACYSKAVAERQPGCALALVDAAADHGRRRSLSGRPASRLFYCPKVSRPERDAGCERLPRRPLDLFPYADRAGRPPAAAANPLIRRSSRSL